LASLSRPRDTHHSYDPFAGWVTEALGGTHLGMLQGIQGLLQGLDRVHLLVNGVLDGRRGVAVLVPQLDGSLVAGSQLLEIIAGIVPGDYRLLDRRLDLLDNLDIAALDQRFGRTLQLINQFFAVV